MKKFKKILITALSLVIICQLAGVFNIVRVYASVGEENSEDVNLQKEGTGALEEGATDGVDGEENLIDPENSEDPEINLMPSVGLAATSAISAPKVPMGGSMVVMNSSPIYDVVINEFMVNPAGDYRDEWVEIYNNESWAVDISGWRISDSDINTYYYTFPAQSIIQSKEYVNIQNYFRLNNDEEDKVILSDSNLIEIDSHIFDTPSKGKSIGRYPDGADIWYEFDLQTPGAPNYLKPIAGVVNDGSGAGIDIDFSNDDTSLSANWSGFHDPVFSIDHYEYSFWQEDSGGDILIVPWTPTVGIQNSITAPAVLLENKSYYASVKAVNTNDIASDIVSSNGVIIDTTPPEILAISFDPSSTILGPGDSLNIILFANEPVPPENIVASFNDQMLSWSLITPSGIISYESTYTVNKNHPTADNLEIINAVITDRADNPSLPFSSSGNDIDVDTTPPDGPLSISVIAGTNNIKINWSASASPDVVGYNIYRASSPYQKINSSLIYGTSYTDNDVEKGIEYYYKVTAVDGVGNETALTDSLVSQSISITAVSKVVGQILESAAKTEGFAPTAYAAPPAKEEGEIKGEEAIKTVPQTESPKEEKEEAKNWPMIIAILIAALIIVAGIWYYWVVTRPAGQYSVSSTPDVRRKSRKKSARRPSRRVRRR